MMRLHDELVDFQILVRCRFAIGHVKAVCRTLWRRIDVCEGNRQWLEVFAIESFGREFWRNAAKYRLRRPCIIDLSLGPHETNSAAISSGRHDAVVYLYVLQRICRYESKLRCIMTAAEHEAHISLANYIRMWTACARFQYQRLCGAAELF